MMAKSKWQLECEIARDVNRVQVKRIAEMGATLGQQQLATRKRIEEDTARIEYLTQQLAAPRASVRERLPDTRKSITRKFSIQRPNDPEGPLEMYVTVGMYPDGRPAEIFLKADKAGSFAAGTLDAVGMALSVAWQHGVPFQPLVEKLRDLRFDPQGMTGDKEFPIVSSALDYVARWLLARFVFIGKPTVSPTPPSKKILTLEGSQKVESPPLPDLRTAVQENIYTGPPCPLCHALTRRSGACYICDRDGTTTGCG